MVARLEVERSDVAPTSRSTTKSSSPPAGTPSMTTFRMRRRPAVKRGLGIGRRLLRGLHRRGELLRLRDERGLLLFRRRGDLLAERVLLGAQRLERGDRGAAFRIRGDRVVDEARPGHRAAPANAPMRSGFSRSSCGSITRPVYSGHALRSAVVRCPPSVELGRRTRASARPSSTTRRRSTWIDCAKPSRPTARETGWANRRSGSRPRPRIRARARRARRSIAVSTS